MLVGSIYGRALPGRQGDTRPRRDQRGEPEQRAHEHERRRLGVGQVVEFKPA